jgi:beta-phosphoglucomutase
MQIRGFIFDLDGVLTDTAVYHYEAWLKLAEKLNLRFDRKMNERLKGVSRYRSFEIILEENDALDRFTEDEINTFITEKNEIYKTLIRQITSDDILPGIKEFLREAKEQDIKLAVASASKNAHTVLRSLGIESMFDYIADASKIVRAKPDPEVFTDCMVHLGLSPWECIGFEDAQAGVEAIKAAGMKAVGIGVEVTSTAPDMNLQSTRELSINKIVKFFY